MDIFKSHNYKVNHYFLSTLGLWPYNNAVTNRIKQVTVVSAIFSITVLQYIKVYEEWGHDIDIVIETICGIIYFSAANLKYLTLLKSEVKMKFMYEKIAEYWNTLNDEMEQRILQDQASKQRLTTIGYITVLNLGSVFFCTLPLAPIILDIIDPLNESRPTMLPYYAEYFVDDQKYFFQLSILSWIMCTLSVQIFCTFDTTYGMCVQQACTLFKVVEYRITETTKLGMKNEFSSIKEEEEVIYKKIVNAIVVHKLAMKFVNFIEECYNIVFFIIIIFNSLIVSAIISGIMLHYENENYKQAIRFSAVYFTFSLHLLFNVYPGQKVIDSSSRIQEAAFHSDWFNTSRKTKQLIHIVMLRSLVPCTLTAWTMVVLNLETFGFVFRKSISYVAVISSIR